jgi:plasmid maintenance system antidote protein VapI
MPRKAKNPQNVVTRLREALSTPNHTVTRELFCKRYGFSPDSIRALERGTYRLTPEMAQRIAAVTGVATASLILDQNPLRAWDGSVFGPDSRPPKGSADNHEIEEAAFFLRAAIQATTQVSSRRDHSRQFLLMFSSWLVGAMAELASEEQFWRALFGSWSDYQPNEGTLQRFTPRHTGKLNVYLDLWGMRWLMIQRAMAQIFCEEQPKAVAGRLRRYIGGALDLDGVGQLNLFRFPKEPLDAERFIHELESAWVRFAKKRGLLGKHEARGLTNEERWKAEKEILFKEALQRLALAKAPLAEPPGKQ